MSASLITYDDATRKETILDIIGDVSPDETPLLTLFGTAQAKGTLDEWLTRNVSRPSTVSSSIEGATTTFADLTTPVRANNVTHIIQQPISVSRTERKVNVAAVGDPYAYQKTEGLRVLKMRMEYAILNSTKASGSSGVARTMAGVDAFITSVVTARNSGTSFSEQELNDMAADAYLNVRADKVFDMLLCTVKIKQAIAGFSGNSTRYIDATEKRLTKDVLVYDSAVGSHRIMHHRDVRNNAGSVTVYGLREELHKIAYLDEPVFEELGKVGDDDRGFWVTEFTHRNEQQLAEQKRTGYNQNG